jgi:hypothetical protein
MFQNQNQTKKQKLGQFYTTNYDYILQGFGISPNVSHIIEPFAGNGDLLSFIHSDTDNMAKPKYVIECYDIDPQKDYIIKRDTLNDPPDFTGKFVLTNPPYLARNKCETKDLYDKYDCNDMYKCFIQLLTQSNAVGGIIIVPLNFLCSIRAADICLRQQFIQKYVIERVNIFEEQVFKDTSYAVCSIQFKLRNPDSEIENDTIICMLYPSKKQIEFILNTSNNYTIGGEIYNLRKGTNYKIQRATRETENSDCITHIIAKCIDDNVQNQIGLYISGNDEDRNKHIDNTPKLSGRSYAVLVIEPPLSMEQQHDLVIRFNEFMVEKRNMYNSLFLTNYRESNTIARKRISFGLVFEICNHLLHTI